MKMKKFKKLKDCAEAKKIKRAYKRIVKIINDNSLETSISRLERDMQLQTFKLNLSAMGYQNVASVRNYNNEFVFSVCNDDFYMYPDMPDFRVYYVPDDDLRLMGVRNYEGYMLEVVFGQHIFEKAYFGDMLKEIEQHTNVFCTNRPSTVFKHRFYYYKLDDGVQAVSEIQRIFLKYSQAEAEQ